MPYEAAIRARIERDAAGFIADLNARSNDKLRFHGVKFFSDGSHPAMSLRLRPPGYLDGGNGLRGDVPWDELAGRMLPFWKAGVQIHRAITIDAAYVLGLERELGSLETGKLADFTVLDGDPLAVEALAIRDIHVSGTVLAGRKQPA